MRFLAIVKNIRNNFIYAKISMKIQNTLKIYLKSVINL